MRLACSCASASSQISVVARSDGIATQDPRDVDGDVAGADHRGDGAVEIDRQIDEVGVGAVPGDQRRRGVAAGEILAGDAEAPVALPADRDDDLIVVLSGGRRP
jgi:hypothetical protein